MSRIYEGPFAELIDEGTRYGHEGYPAQVFADGSTSSSWRPDGYAHQRAECACGWRGQVEHPVGDAGEDAALAEWDTAHLRPMLTAAAARRVVPAQAVLELLHQIGDDVEVQLRARGDVEGPLTERERGWCDVRDRLADLLRQHATPMGRAR